MKLEKLSVIAMGFSIFMMIFANPGFAQQKNQEQSPKIKTSEPSSVIIIGQVANLQSEGGYYIRGDHPFEVFKIANQNPAILEKLLKSGNKHLNFEGHLTGPNLLFIVKIDGQPYAAAEKPAPK